MGDQLSSSTRFPINLITGGKLHDAALLLPCCTKERSSRADPHLIRTNPYEPGAPLEHIDVRTVEVGY
jgi:hypothetical protein